MNMGYVQTALYGDLDVMEANDVFTDAALDGFTDHLSHLATQRLEALTDFISYKLDAQSPEANANRLYDRTARDIDQIAPRMDADLRHILLAGVHEAYLSDEPDSDAVMQALHTAVTTALEHSGRHQIAIKGTPNWIV